MRRGLGYIAIWLLLQPLAIFAAFVVFLDRPLWWLLMGLAMGIIGAGSVWLIAWKRRQRGLDDTLMHLREKRREPPERLPRGLLAGVVETVVVGIAVGVFFAVRGGLDLAAWLVMLPVMVVFSVILAVGWYIGRGSMW